jgi:hypothetical protein
VAGRDETQEALFTAIKGEVDKIAEGKSTMAGGNLPAALLELAQAFAYTANPDSK